MAKSYASSEIGGDDSHIGDPEFAKDFNSAYSKVNLPLRYPADS